MTKYRNYRNKMEMFLASRKGRRFLHIAYSWGAAVVILGALFKLLHLPFGNQMLFIGMMTEFFVFFLSGLEKPQEQYKWEQVYPELLSINPMDREEMANRRAYLAHKAKEAHERVATLQEESDTSSSFNEVDELSHASLAGSKEGRGVSPLREVTSEEDIEKLSHSISRLNEAVERLATLGELSASTLENSSTILAQQESLGKETIEYKERLTSLNKTMGDLHRVYESQLSDITNQVQAIDEINQRLDQIRYAYQSSQMDSETFRRENSEMVHRLRDLNQVYARLLDAMTINMASMPAPSYRESAYPPQGTYYRPMQGGESYSQDPRAYNGGSPQEELRHRS